MNIGKHGISVLLVLISLALYGVFKAELTPFTELEVWGTITGIWSVWLAVLNRPSNWAVGILNEALFFALFWSFGLYANALLQVLVFFPISLWGMYKWMYGGQGRTELPISHMADRMYPIYLAAIILGAGVLGLVIYHFTGVFSWMDTLTTAMSIVATYMLARRQIENWMLWYAADVIYLFLFVNQGLYLTAGLYVLFALLCVKGFYDWKQIFSKERQTNGR